MNHGLVKVRSMRKVPVRSGLGARASCKSPKEVSAPSPDGGSSSSRLREAEMQRARIKIQTQYIILTADNTDYKSRNSLADEENLFPG